MLGPSDGPSTAMVMLRKAAPRQVGLTQCRKRTATLNCPLKRRHAGTSPAPPFKLTRSAAIGDTKVWRKSIHFRKPFVSKG